MENNGGPTKPRVLLVEDNETYRKAVKVALEAYGFEVAEAENGKIALDTIGTFMPHVVVSDIYMPEMDGLTFLSEVKKKPELLKIPFVMLTNVQEEIDNSVKLGADESIFKASVTPRQIADICQLHIKQAQEENVSAPVPPATPQS